MYYKFPVSYHSTSKAQACLLFAYNSRKYKTEYKKEVDEARKVGQYSHAMLHRMLEKKHQQGRLYVKEPLDTALLSKAAKGIRHFIKDIMPGLGLNQFKLEKKLRLRASPALGRRILPSDLFPEGYIPGIVSSNSEAHILGIIDFIGWNEKEIHIIDFKLFREDYSPLQLSFYAALVYWWKTGSQIMKLYPYYIVDGVVPEEEKRVIWTHRQIEDIHQTIKQEIEKACLNLDQRKNIVPKKCYYCTFCSVRYAGECPLYK